MYHYRRSRKVYAKHNKNDAHVEGCTFCIDETRVKAIDENEHAYIVRNRVSYDVFEGKEVLEHLLLVPKRHVESLAELKNDEKIAILDMMGKYEMDGYSVYARSVDSSTRSVKHQHTHLLKQKQSQARLLVYIKKPYTLIKF